MNTRFHALMVGLVLTALSLSACGGVAATPTEDAAAMAAAHATETAQVESAMEVAHATETAQVESAMAAAHTTETAQVESAMAAAHATETATAEAAMQAAHATETAQAPKTINLTQGWYQGRQTFYYDFGSNSPVLNEGKQVGVAPLYVFVTGFDAQGKPQFLAGQHNIVSAIPGEKGYSDLWRVNFVVVPSTYVADAIKSVAEIMGGGFEIKESDVLVNCPIVPKGTRLAESTPGLTQGWYNGEAIYYFDFGPNPADTAPLYAFITGLDANGNPQFVEGQQNVLSVIPGDEGYSAFWDVNLVKVPAGYQPNSIKSVAEIMSGGFEILHPGIVVNCPVARTASP